MKNPKISIEHGLTSNINNSLSENYIRFFEYDSIICDTDDEKMKEYSMRIFESAEYIEQATIKSLIVVKKELESLNKYEIVAFDVLGGILSTKRIKFFIKLTEEEEEFIVLTLIFDCRINTYLFLSQMFDLRAFRYYGSNDLYGFYMKDKLTKYEFELLSTKEFVTNILNFPFPITESYEWIYFIIKNNIGDPVIFTLLETSNDIEAFNMALTKVDPQVGLLFSLSYNANK